MDQENWIQVSLIRKWCSFHLSLLISFNVLHIHLTSVSLPRMPQTRLIYILVFTLVFLSVASAAEVRHVHDAGSSQSIETDDISGVQSNDASDHCTHCCHAHASGLLQSDYTLSASELNQPRSSEELRVHNSSQGPPTPPPNTNIIWFYPVSLTVGICCPWALMLANAVLDQKYNAH